VTHRETFELATKTLRRNPLRSALTLVGITIGVGAVVTMVANNGELVVNGTATVTQGFRIESMLKRLAGVTRVTSWFSTSGA